MARSHGLTAVVAGKQVPAGYVLPTAGGDGSPRNRRSVNLRWRADDIEPYALTDDFTESESQVYYHGDDALAALDHRRSY